MEKQKKIKIRRDTNSNAREEGYFVNKEELKKALKGIDLGSYAWIMAMIEDLADPLYKEVYLPKKTIKELNNIWKKNRKK